MKPPARPSLRDAAAVAAVGVVCALTMGLGLASLSSPSDFVDRVDALETRTQASQDLIRKSRAAPVFAADALCHRDADRQAQGLRAELAALATQTNLTLDGLDTHLESPSETASALAPVRLRFTTTGSYENVVLLLQNLSRHRPELFADTVDLTAKTANVTLTFSGRVFCAA